MCGYLDYTLPASSHPDAFWKNFVNVRYMLNSYTPNCYLILLSFVCLFVFPFCIYNDNLSLLCLFNYARSTNMAHISPTLYKRRKKKKVVQIKLWWRNDKISKQNVTKRKETEKKWKRTMPWLETTMDETPGGVIKFTLPNWNKMFIMYVNLRFCFDRHRCPVLLRVYARLFSQLILIL